MKNSDQNLGTMEMEIGKKPHKIPELTISFLWTSATYDDDESTVRTHRIHDFHAFHTTGNNQYLIYCTPSFISIGGGNGKYGLWIGADLNIGFSCKCETFCNDNLIDNKCEGIKRFEILGMEIWKIG